MEQTELSENVKPKKQAVDHHLPHFFRGSVGYKVYRISDWDDPGPRLARP